MNQTMWAGAVMTAAVWTIFTAAIAGGYPAGPKDVTWASASSDKIASHPTLVRVAKVSLD